MTTSLTVALLAYETFLTSSRGIGREEDALMIPDAPFALFFFFVKQLSSSFASITLLIIAGIENGMASLKRILCHNLTSFV